MRGLILLVMFLAMPAVASAQVRYIATSGTPTGSGVLLPGEPTSTDSVFFHDGLGATFTNSCWAHTASGPSEIVVDEVLRVVRVDFDETQATYPFGICIALYSPVTAVEIEFGPLSPGEWTLEIDEMLSAYFFPIPAQTIQFTVVSAAPVPAGGAGFYALLIAGLVLVGHALLSRRSNRWGRSNS